MSYDADSFKAGFALGRILWRPPTLRGDQDTGLGWAADPEYLVRAEGYWICNVGSRVFSKYVDGPAIAVTQDHCTSNWVGPMLISTVREYVYTTQGPGQAIGTFEYGGLTWYASYSYWLPDANYSSHVPVITAADGTWPNTSQGGVDMAKYVMRKAHLRIY